MGLSRLLVGDSHIDSKSLQAPTWGLFSFQRPIRPFRLRSCAARESRDFPSRPGGGAVSNRDRGGGLAYAVAIMPSDRFARDKATIRAALERRTRARQTMTYGEVARRVSRAAQGLGKIGGVSG